MKNYIPFLVFAAAIFGCSSLKKSKPIKTEEVMNESVRAKDEMGSLLLGAFSVSIAVKDLTVSKEFYEKLGFEAMGGDVKMNYLIMKNGTTLIGLFQGMFEGNILTFNPGWDENAENLDEYQDVRLIQKHLKSKGVKLDTEADATTTGPASVILKDPDGNVIFIDQHR